jgi:tetratricopeptide (TPR) repeat protein
VLIVVSFLFLALGIGSSWFSFPVVQFHSCDNPVQLASGGAFFEIFFKGALILLLIYWVLRIIKYRHSGMIRQNASYLGWLILALAYLFSYFTVNYDSAAMARCKWLNAQHDELFLLPSSMGFSWEQYQWHRGTVMDRTAEYPGSIPFHVTEWRQILSEHIDDLAVLIGFERSFAYFADTGWVAVILSGICLVLGGYFATERDRVITKFRREVLHISLLVFFSMPVLLAPWLLSTRELIEADKSTANGNIKEAEQHLEKAAFLFPSLYTDLRYLSRKGELQAIAGKTVQPEYHFYRATLFEDENDYAKALLHYRKAVSLSSGNLALRFTYARFLDFLGRNAYLSGQYGNAHLYFMEALSYADAGVQILFHIAETAFQTRQDAFLRSAANTYLQLQLTFPSPVWNSMSQLYARMAWALYRQENFVASLDKIRIASDQMMMKKDINSNEH